MIRDASCTACRLGLEATPKDVCLPAFNVQVGKKPKTVIVTPLPLSAKAREELIPYLLDSGFDMRTTAFTAVNRCMVWDMKPNRSDQKTCKSLFLDDELKELQAEIIIAMGAESLAALTGKTKITAYLGQTFIHPSGAKVIPSMALGAIKRNPGLTQSFKAGLTYIHSVLEGVNTSDKYKPERYVRVMSKSGLQALADKLSSSRRVSIDIESNGFDEFRDDSIMVSVAFTFFEGLKPKEMWALPLGHPDSPFVKNWRKVLRWLGKFLADVQLFIGANGKFDMRWMRQFTRKELDLGFDTLLAGHLLDENAVKGLKPRAQAELGVAPWGIDVKDLMNESLDKVLKYNALDTWYTAWLYVKFRAELRKNKRLYTLFTKVMMPASNIFTEIEMRGIWIDVEKLDTNAKIAKDMLDDINERLTEYVPDKSEWPERLQKSEINFNASNFARWFLFEHLQLPVLARGKTKENGDPGDPSMAEGLIASLRETNPHPVLDLMAERVKWQKYHSSFFSAYQAQIDPRTDRIHSTFKLHGTVTGRLSSGKNEDDKVVARVQNRGVNLQQVPRDKFVKGIFGGEPGSVFLECDYSQIELRIAAQIAGERHMQHLYNTGQDLHMAMAMKMTGKRESDITSEERKSAKPVNFGYLYAMQAAKFVETAWNQYGIRVTLEEAKASRRAYFEQYPDLLTWHARQKRLVSHFKRVESPFGRIRHLPDIDSKDPMVRREAERQAINSPVQAMASDMALMALVTLTDELKAKGLRTRSVGTVHDAINLEVPVTELMQVIPMMKSHMENPPMEEWFGVRLDVPIIGDIALSKMWGDKEEIPADIIYKPKELQQWLSAHHLTSEAA